ncbi:hypothetical protein [Acuticoccus sediminis]|uniref:hypothetical protein n=1 Tax=Acuticoccus sediminis TaxID=2184697 RepID=UPI0013917B34|nr:hypothetical protein [Acuticoccus sediminis]
MLKVVQAFDRAPVAEIDTDDAAALERKLAANACMGSILTAAGFGWRLVGT